MKPPICELCRRRADGVSEFKLVRFADCRDLPAGMPGHPDGLLWFCGAHHDAAKALAHLPADQAMQGLRAALRPRRFCWFRK